jgi:two-component system, OmpR family, sensor kinase
MRSLFSRVFLSLWAAIALIAAVTASVTAWNFIAAVDAPNAFAREASTVLDREGLSGLKRFLQEHNNKDTRRRVLIVDDAGNDILGQHVPGFARHLSRIARRSETEAPAPGQAGPSSSPSVAEHAGPPPPPRFPIPRIAGPDGSTYIVVFDPHPRRGPFAPPFSWPARVMLLAAALAISGLVSYLLARSISRPLEHLQSTARALSTGNLAARTATSVSARRDEIGLLAREFDSMAERLSALIAARSQLLRDISHELRSPLARLQLAVGLSRQANADREAQLDRIERESARLETMIAQMLEFARLERDPATLAFETVDVAALISQIVHDAEFESQSPAGRVTVSIDPSAGAATTRADPQVLHAAIDNVVRNALLHGAGTRVEIELSQRARQLHLTVRDHGPGVPGVDLGRIFEPFYRSGRTDRDRSVEGSGIGLALTAKAVALHGGHVGAENVAGGGLRVTITLPVPEDGQR